MDGVEVERVFLASRHGGEPLSFSLRLALPQDVVARTENSLDVVHCHDLDTLPLGFVLGKLKRKPIVL
jgi:hypothetical protein